MQRFIKITTKETIWYGCLLAFALIVSYVEVLFPLPIGIPGVKLGLANSVVVLCMYLFGTVPALLINVARIILSGFLFGNLYSMWYSLSGAFLSFTVMFLFRKCKSFGMIGVSVLGGVFHNFGQLLIALAITKVPILVYYIPVLLIFGVGTGFANGIVARMIYNRTGKIIKSQNIEEQNKDLNIM